MKTLRQGPVATGHVDLTKYGGYSTENARQRLNRFCVQHGLVCNITNEVGGTPHTKTTTAKLKLVVNGQEFNAEATSSVEGFNVFKAYLE